ncbi:MAG: hypothetical protein AB1689_00860 [Thermodesulfobacteriota bacterium]
MSAASVPDEKPMTVPHSLGELVVYFLQLGTLALLVRATKIPEPLVIVAAGVLGFVVWTATGR